MTAHLQALPAAGTWRISDSRTRVTFTVAGLLGLPVHGSVACRWGQMEFGAAGDPVRVQAELDLDSLSTGIARRDADLRAPRFLDVDRHPVMTWTADRFARTGDGAWRAEGVLAVRGTTAPLTVCGGPDPTAAQGAGIRVRATGALDRTAVGIRAPSLLVGRVVRVHVDAWLTPARP